MSATMPLFEIQPSFKSKNAFEPESFFRNAVEVIKAQLTNPEFGCVAPAVSFGKDSSLVLSLVLEAARELVAGGRSISPIVVLTSNTLVENPIQIHLMRTVSAQVRRYADEHGLPVSLVVAQPTPASSWAVKVISAQGLPPMPGGSGACTEDWKIKPMRTALNRWLREHGIELEPLKLTGTRFAESNERARKMQMRGESATEIFRNKDGEALLSPIAHLGADDVWELIGWFRAGLLPSFTDWDAIMTFYETAGGTECAVVADERLSQQKGSCSPRGGCWACTKVDKDLSLMNMLEQHPELDGLYRLREYIAAITFDFSKRTIFGRTIEEGGYLKLAPDGFDAETCQDLLRYCLTLDQLERTRVSGTDEEPLFEIISLEQLVLIDTYWSLHGLAPAFEAWRIFKGIVEQGERYPIPSLARAMRTLPPAPRYLHVGENWDVGEYDALSYRWTGLLDPLRLALTEDTPCEAGVRQLDDGRVIPDYDTASQVRVRLDRDETWDFFQFILDDEIESAARLNLAPHYAVQIYLQYGVVEPTSLPEWDNMLRRLTFRYHHGLHRGAQLSDLTDRSISEAEYKSRIGKSSEGQTQLFL